MAAAGEAKRTEEEGGGNRRVQSSRAGRKGRELIIRQANKHNERVSVSMSIRGKERWLFARRACRASQGRRRCVRGVRSAASPALPRVQPASDATSSRSRQLACHFPHAAHPLLSVASRRKPRTQQQRRLEVAPTSRLRDFAISRQFRSSKLVPLDGECELRNAQHNWRNARAGRARGQSAGAASPQPALVILLVLVASASGLAAAAAAGRRAGVE